MLDDIAGPPDVPGIQKVRAEEAWIDNRDLDAELLDFRRYRQPKAFDCRFRSCLIGNVQLDKRDVLACRR